ncbi:hypothetical protein DFP72DRAFT_1068533 [Ephemerocybe angulata]|uniref:CxC1-like cysteine cluster associated with KDZ transposases domain-containing protein n=1 Tax=Ephemerocybe angulata TaxID=980116 RepID=A0A8H6M715_9AGAR|nr:hypothetical protein DFP72DRAFT_1068533 [Tulosesus angulatus]
MGGDRNKGSSRSVTVSFGRSSYGKGSGSTSGIKRPHTQVLSGLEQISQHRKEKEKQRKLAEQHLDDDTMRTLADMRGDGGYLDGGGGGDDDMGDGGDSGGQWVDISDRMTAEELARAVDVALTDPKYALRHYRDGRTWRNRRQRFDAQWGEHFEAMTSAYLRWRYPGPAEADKSAPDSSASPGSDLNISIATVDLYTLLTEAVIPRRDDQVTAVALVEAGYLGNSPVNPSLAISLKTLDLFKIIRQRRPSFSFEAFAKVLCDLYQKPYHRQWRIALADAFDVFLTIKGRVDAQIAEALGRQSGNWRVLNACPPCTYELEKEPELRYRVLMSVDGNNSARRVDSRFRKAGDTRHFSSDYFLDPVEVDKFKLEDIRSTGPEVPPPALFEEDKDGDVEGEGEDESAVKADLEISECVKNWKAAQSDNKKRVMDMFDETGWFASGCRHGIILWVADMVRTGEQAKYPLSIINRALEVLGDKLLIGYDIGCAFEGTIKSTTLGKKFVDSGSRCCVNAYHGYAHNYACQVKNHPNNIEGVGIEDLETMERFFSASNATAPVTRYTSKYRRRMLLDLFLKQHDRDKYSTIGLMIRNNYQQALDIIRDGKPLLDRILSESGYTKSDLDNWQKEQAQYFSTLGKEREEDIYKVAYVELLQELSEAEKAAASKTSGFLNVIPEDWDMAEGAPSYESELSRTRKLETMRRHAREKVDRLAREVMEMELKLGFTTRWDTSTPEYKETQQYIKNHQYHKALDDIQRLVVQRLFELHRLGLSGIGYRARSLLAKALQTRSKAIKNAVIRYNNAAAELDPPAQTLDWTKIAKYNFVEEFNLLRQARKDVQPGPWSDGEVREAMKLHQKIKRAGEEIVRLNVEMRRLFTSIHDEHALFAKVQQNLSDLGQYQLLGALNDFVIERRRVNRSLVSYLDEIKTFDGYTGSQDLLGLRRGTVRQSSDAVSGDLDKVEEGTADEYISDSEGEDEEEAAQRGGVIDFVAEQSLS